MKKILLVLILAMFGFTSLFSEDTSFIKDEPFYYEPEYETYNTTFTPLTGKETLTFDQPDNSENSKLVVYRTSSGKKEVLGVWKDVSYGAIRISVNGKKLIFQIGRSDYYKPVIMINGNTGKISYCFTSPNGLRADKYLDYIITDNYSFFSFFSLPYNTPIEIPFYVARLADRKIIRKHTWSLLHHHGGLDCGYSSKEGYDFSMTYDVEAFIEAQAYYNVEEDLLTVTLPQGNPISVEEWYNMHH